MIWLDAAKPKRASLAQGSDWVKLKFSAMNFPKKGKKPAFRRIEKQVSMVGSMQQNAKIIAERLCTAIMASFWIEMMLCRESILMSSKKELSTAMSKVRPSNS